MPSSWEWTTYSTNKLQNSDSLWYIYGGFSTLIVDTSRYGINGNNYGTKYSIEIIDI